MTKVDETITAYGKNMDVYQFVSLEDRPDYPNNAYEQKVPVYYRPPTVVVGRVLTEPSEEIITAIGKRVEWDVAILWSRLEMLRKFPSGEENKWINEDDFVYDGDTYYSLTKVFPSGQIKDYRHLVIGAAIKKRSGQKIVTIPRPA